jgi:hypothetical protein
MNQDVKEQMDAQESRNLTAQAASTATRAAQEKQQAKLQNEYFLNELRKSDLDSDLVDWLEEEFPTWFSGAHAVTNRSDTWDEESDLLMMNKRERAFAESNPGRLLRDRPYLLAIAQGEFTNPNNARDPMTSDERRAVYGGAEVAADLMSLSKNAAGLEATTTATTETRVRREEQEDSTTSKVGKVFE